MASVSAQTSSTTFATSSTHQINYDVFLSFRGTDTRTGFTDHLYAALLHKGIPTSRDDEELKRGKAISPELLKAIEESRISVVILSRNYASSTWCLDELAKIVECMNKSGLIVLPVFYDVVPSQVRKQTGTFQEAFTRYEQVFRDDLDKVKNWREALFQVANLSGWDIKDRHETEVIKDIVEHILSELNHTPLSDFKDFVEIDRVKEIELDLGVGLDEVRVIGICGMPGIGKTTIAQVIFERMHNEFEASSFIANVGEISKKKGLFHIREQLYGYLLNSKVSIQNVNVIRSRLRYKRVLIILDDVDQLEQIEAVIGKGDEELYVGFGRGSRIIITTRDESLLRKYGAKAYKLEKLTYNEALQLFCRKAFMKDHPIEEFANLSHDFVNYADGLPLALVHLGSFLLKRSVKEWSSELGRLTDNNYSDQRKIIDILKVSFDGLENPEKQIFLDIACFFKGEDECRVKRIFESCGCYPDISIQILLEKSLITITEGELWMHDLLQEMGKEIVRGESQEPGNRSRLWLHMDALHVLMNNKGTEAVEGIFINSHQEDNMHFMVDPFLRMYKLRLLKICNVKFSGSVQSLSNELRFLEWHECPLKSLPSSFKRDKLVELHLPQSRVEQLWKQVRMPMQKLFIIDLSECEYLTKTPDLSAVPRLEKLILKGCKRLSEVHPSIGVLQQLLLLNLEGCESLSTLPHRISLGSLIVFILSGCSKLKMFPEIGENMKALKKLYLDGTSIKELPTSIKNLTGLVFLKISGCKNLLSLPDVICTLKSLESLKLSCCSNLEDLPQNLGSLGCLKDLDLSRTAIGQAPSSIQLLKNLKILSFAGCRSDSDLRVLDSWCSSLFSCCLLPSSAPSSGGLQLPASFSGLSSLTELDLSNCNLSEGAIPDDIGCLSSLQHLDLSGNNFMSLPESICELSQLECIELNNCSKLKSLPKLPLNIQQVKAKNCPLLGTYSNKVTVWTSSTNAGGLSVVDCLPDDPNKKFQKHPIPQSYIPTLTRKMLEDGINRGHGFGFFCHQTEVPAWLSHSSIGSSVTIPLLEDLGGDRTSSSRWKGLALCFVCAPVQEEHETSSSTTSSILREGLLLHSHCQLYTNEGPLEDAIPNEIFEVSFDKSCGVWRFIPRSWFKQRLKRASFIRASIIWDRVGVKVKACGACLIYEENVAGFVRNLCDLAYQGHPDLVDLMTNPPVKAEEPNKSNQQEQESTASQHGAEHSPTSKTTFLIEIEPHTSTSYSSSSKIVGQLRRNVESLLAKAFKALWPPTVKVEMCGIREVFDRDLYGLIQTISRCTIRSPLVHYGVNEETLVLDGQTRVFDGKPVAVTYMNHRLLEVAKSIEQNPMQEVKYVCPLAPLPPLAPLQRGFSSLQKLTPSNTSRDSKSSTVNGDQVIQLDIWADTPFTEKHSVMEWKTNLELLLQYFSTLPLSLSIHLEGVHFRYKLGLFNPHNHYSACFDLKEIPKWFMQKHHDQFVVFPPTPNLVNDENWMGFAVCASFSVLEHPTAVLNNLGSGLSYQLICQLRTKAGYASGFYHPISMNKFTWMYLRGFIWLCYFAREGCMSLLHEQDSLKVHIFSDSPGLVAESCSLRLLYKQDVKEFKQVLVQCVTSSLDNLPLVRQLLEDDAKQSKRPTSTHVDDLRKNTSLFYHGETSQSCSSNEASNSPRTRVTPSYPGGTSSESGWNQDQPPDFDRYLTYNSCFPPNDEIPEWFGQHSYGHSTTIPLPLILYSDGSNWLGLALYAYFSVLPDHPTANLDDSTIPAGTSHHLVCHLELERGCLEHPVYTYCTTNKELEWLYQQGGFIWLSYIPRGCIESDVQLLNEFNLLEASIGSDRPGSRVQKCGLHIVYQHNEEEFKQAIMHWMTSLCDINGKNKQNHEGDDEAGSSSSRTRTDM